MNNGHQLTAGIYGPVVGVGVAERGSRLEGEELKETRSTTRRMEPRLLNSMFHIRPVKQDLAVYSWEVARMNLTLVVQYCTVKTDVEH